MSEKDITRLERAIEKLTGRMDLLVTNIAETNVELAKVTAICPHQQALIKEAREDMKKLDGRLDVVEAKTAAVEGERRGVKWVIGLIAAGGGAAGAKILDWLGK